MKDRFSQPHTQQRPSASAACSDWQPQKPGAFSANAQMEKTGKIFSRRPACQRSRRGISSLELLVAGVLISAIMATTLPLFVQHHRLIVMAGRERLAVEELANQAEQLRVTPPGDWHDAIASLQPSPVTARRLPGVQLTASQNTTSLGMRVVLQLHWNDPGRQQHPLTLAVWLPAAEEQKVSQ